MELLAAAIIFFVEVTVGILSCLLWLRNRSELPAAKAQLAKSLQHHQNSGTLEQYIADLTAGNLSIFQKRKQFTRYLWTGISMVLGVLATILVVRLARFGIVARTITGILSILPFICMVSIVIAEETDENRILSFEQTVRKQLAQNGAISPSLVQLAE
jgi:nicotinamide riboside transporter PnuC